MTPSNKSSTKLPHSWQFVALGTSWSIDTAQVLDESLRERVTGRIEQFDKTYSRFRDDSLVDELRSPGQYVLPDDSTKLLGLYEQLYELTDGQMTPLIGSMLEDAGYDKVYSLTPRDVIRPVPDWSSLGWDGVHTLHTRVPLTLDVGAAGKGYLVDIVAELLEQHGVAMYTIDASGDIRQTLSEPVLIGLEHPTDPTKIIGTARLATGSLCASAINRRVWADGMHHVFDPTLRRPTRSKLATWVVSEEAMIADGLATALFFVEPERLLPHFAFDYVTIGIDGTVDYSVDFDGELFV